MPNDDERRFLEVFKESIQETIQGIVGENPGRALLFHLKFPQSAEKPDEFGRNLRAVLLAGSPIVEVAIVKRLWDKMGLLPARSNEQSSFEESVRKARQVFGGRQVQHQVFAR